MLQLQLLQDAPGERREATLRASRKRRAELGQFMTPPAVARFMASMFPPGGPQSCCLLDAGAGRGSLSCAFLDRWEAGGFDFRSVEIHAHEIDDALRACLEEKLADYTARLGVRTRIEAGDFIEAAAERYLKGQTAFTHAILNPPYRKIRSRSHHRLALRRVGIETVNLYSAFVASALALMVPGGRLVAIIPRSFCNGPYYRPFRNFLLEHAALRRVHLFAARNRAFKDDGVLQENVILLLERGGRQDAVTISTSTDGTFSDLATHVQPFTRIVRPGDPERFIHVPTSPECALLEQEPAFRYSPGQLGLRISTGPVVDFRVREYLRAMPGPGTMPLLYPAHFTSRGTAWPQPDGRKPNAIAYCPDTEKWLYPTGCYCVVRRFSSKEQPRRVMAHVVDPKVFAKAPLLGFENHLNLFHERKRGLPEALARGLAVFLNTTIVDAYFRRFNGHTQVNATDLRMLKYPCRAALLELGEWARHHDSLTQDSCDAILHKLLA